MKNANHRAANRRYMRTLYARWRANGCCGSCGLPIERFAKCLKCRRRYAKTNLNYLHRSAA